MKFESGKDKIQKICDTMRKETLEPARQEAREILENAHLAASEIVQAAKKEADDTIRKAAIEIEAKKKIFESSLLMACRQGIERLKQKIEEELFHRELSVLVDQEMGDPKAVAHILNTFMKLMAEKEIDDEFIAVIPQSMTPRSLNSLLITQALERLKKGEIVLGEFGGGAQIRLKGRQITIDISDAVVRELIAQHIRRDFRELVFSV